MINQNKIISPFNQSRSVSRLSTVQALYQIEFSGENPEAVIEEFISRRFGSDLDGDKYAEADLEFFKLAVSKGASSTAKIDSMLIDALSKDHSLDRLDGILRALLRAATFELIDRKEIPLKVVLDEYLDIAHAFFSGTEPKLVNGVLDTLAHRLRPDEFK